MRLRFLLFLVIAFTLPAWLAGCRRQPAMPTPTVRVPTASPARPTPTPPPAFSPLPSPTPSPDGALAGLAVGLLTSGPVNDVGWNQAAFEGLQMLTEQGAAIANSENVAAGDQINLLRSYAEGGFDVIIGHGAEFSEALVAVAQEYPDAHFIQLGGTASNPGNLASFSFRPGEAAYAAGIVAGLMMESGRLGGLGSVESPNSAADFEAFRQGAQAVNASVTDLPVLYTGADAAHAKDIAINLFESGSELILAHAGIDPAIVSEAATEVSQGAYVIGWSFGSPAPAASPLVATIQQQVGEVLVAAVAAVKNGDMEWKNHVVGFGEGVYNEGVQNLTLNADVAPAGVAAEMDAVIQALIDGKIVLDEGGHVIKDDYHPKDSQGL